MASAAQTDWTLNHFCWMAAVSGKLILSTTTAKEMLQGHKAASKRNACRYCARKSIFRTQSYMKAASNSPAASIYGVSFPEVHAPPLRPASCSRKPASRQLRFLSWVGVSRWILFSATLNHKAPTVPRHTSSKPPTPQDFRSARKGTLTAASTKESSTQLGQLLSVFDYARNGLRAAGSGEGCRVGNISLPTPPPGYFVYAQHGICWIVFGVSSR